MESAIFWQKVPFHIFRHFKQLYSLQNLRNNLFSAIQACFSILYFLCKMIELTKTWRTCLRTFSPILRQFNRLKEHNSRYTVVNNYRYSILRLIEPPVNRTKLLNRVTWQKTEHINSVNLLRLIGPTPLFRLIGSKLPAPDVTLLSGVYCI